MKVERRIGRRALLRATAMAAAGVALGACQPQVVETVVEKEVTRVVAATQAPPQKVHLLLDCYRATPSDPQIQLREGEKPVIGLGPFMDDYMAEHPNVEIEFYYKPANVPEGWLEARMAARDAPDWFYTHGEGLWPHIHKGWALDITAWLKSPNPYMPGGRVWESYLREIGRAAVMGPDGKTYGVCLDGQGVLTFYNKSIFEELGLQEYRTWSEAMEVWQKCKDAGYIAFGGDLGGQCCYPHWSFGHTYNQLAYDTILQYDDSGDLFVINKELVQHTLKGDFDQWDEFLGCFKLFKEQAPYLPDGFRGEVDYRTMFRQGKVAMYMENNGFGVTYQRDPPPFEIGFLDYPIITAEQWPGSREKIVRIDGPWGNMQYHVTGYLKDKEPEKLPVLRDLLMYISQPHIVGAVSAEGGMIPFVEGAPVAPNMEPWMRPYDRAVTWQSWSSLGGTAYEQQRNLMGEYMNDELTDDELLEKGKKAWDEEVTKLLDNNPDWADLSNLG